MKLNWFSACLKYRLLTRVFFMSCATWSDTLVLSSGTAFFHIWFLGYVVFGRIFSQKYYLTNYYGSTIFEICMAEIAMPRSHAMYGLQSPYFAPDFVDFAVDAAVASPHAEHFHLFKNWIEKCKYSFVCISFICRRRGRHSKVADVSYSGWEIRWQEWEIGWKIKERHRIRRELRDSIYFSNK